jgi:zinc protease
VAHATLRLVRLRTSVAVLLFVASPLAAQLPAGVKKGAMVEGITEYTLDNGLRVLLFADGSKPTATINITYLAGSRFEGYGETGMTHLLEHLAFKGTPGHPDIPRELTEHGARPNGTTSYDRTNYYETVPATDVNINWALDLEADRMVNSFIARKDLESEFTVVRNEFESGENSPFRILLERTFSTMFLWHNYGKSTIGARADIERVPIDRLQAFYHKYYQPDNAVLVVAGKIDEPKVLAMIAGKFGSIPRPVRSVEKGNVLYRTYTEEPVQDGERTVTLRRTGDVQVVMVAYHIVPGSHPDFAAVDVLNEALASRPGGRLYKALVDAGHVTSVGGSAFQLREPGMLLFSATLRKDQNVNDATRILIESAEAAGATPFATDDIERAKTTLLKNIDLEMNNSEAVALDLSEWQSMGDWRLIFLNRDRIKKVTPADVQRVAAAFLKPSNRTVGTFLPTDKSDRATIATVTENDVTAMVRDYKGNAAVAMGEVFDPSPANIDARTTRSTLSNGMKLALLPKQTRGNTVTARVTLRFGDVRALTGRANTASMMGSMLDKGTGTRTRQEIKDAFDKLKAQASFFSSGNAITATITTTHENLIPALRLAAEVLRTPSFDAGEFEKLRAERLAQIEQGRSEPAMLATISFQRKMNPYPMGHPLAMNTIDDDIASYKAITVVDVRRVYDDLVGATFGDVSVVGDFNKDSVTTVLATALGTWKSPTTFSRLVRTYFDVPRFADEIETPDKANAFFVAGQNLRIRDDSKDYAALTLGNYVLGGGAANSRLATRIRQQEGISYGIGSNFVAQSLDSVGTFATNAIYNPENVVRLEGAFAEEIDRALTRGLTAEEIARAKDGWLQQQLQNRSNDGFLASVLSSQALTGRTMGYYARLEQWVSGLTVDDVNGALRKYIDPSKISMVKSGDFANHPPKAAPIKP